jgi:hypothetical protein
LDFCVDVDYHKNQIVTNFCDIIDIILTNSNFVCYYIDDKDNISNPNDLVVCRIAGLDEKCRERCGGGTTQLERSRR